VLEALRVDSCLQAGQVRLEHHFVLDEILRGLERREAFDEAGEFPTHAIIRRDGKHRIAVQVVGTGQRQRMGEHDANRVRLAHLPGCHK
jgi:hypothetical protein